MRPLSFLNTRELATWVNESIEKLADNYGNEHFYKNPEKKQVETFTSPCIVEPIKMKVFINSLSFLVQLFSASFIVYHIF